MDDNKNNQKYDLWYSLSIGIFAGLLVGFAISSIISTIKTHANHQNIFDLSMESKQSINSDFGKAPHFDDTYNQNGKKIKSGTLKGKVQIVSFINPYNNTYDPILITHLRNLFTTLNNDHLLGKKVVLVSYNMYSKDTDKSLLKKYLTRVAHISSTQASDWEFLSAKESTIENIVAGHYGIQYRILNNSQYQKYKQKMMESGRYDYYKSYDPLVNKKRANKYITDINKIMIVSPRGNIKYKINEASKYPNSKLMKDVISLLDLPGMHHKK